MNALYESEHFILHPLADGVYAAIATEMGAGFSNAGLIDLGGRTLAFDAFENPQAAADLLDASVRLTGRKPAVVAISHMHPDHWGGAQVFAGSAILSTHATRQAMLPFVEALEREKRDPSRTEANIAEAEARLVEETDPLRRRALQAQIARLRHTLEALPGLLPTLPDSTFDGRIVFHGAHRSAELIATGRGHTESDCILRLPEDRLAFIGDLGFFRSQPYTVYGSSPEWLALLDSMDGWEEEIFVPGHGPVGGKADLALEAKYIRALEDLVRSVVQAGGPVEDALRQTLPPPFDEWQPLGRRFEANVRAAYARGLRVGTG